MKRPLVQCACLLALLVVALVYQVRLAEYALPQWFPRAHAVYGPVALVPTPDGLAVQWEHSRAFEAGIRDGDVLADVNGQPVTGTATYGQAIVKAYAGEKLKFTVMRRNANGQWIQRNLSYVMPHASHAVHALDILFSVVMPVFCLVLGFWVAAVRPRDSLAWLLLALMLSFPGFSDPGAEFWGPWLRDFGEAYHTGLFSTWPLWMFLFGIYFPERFPAKSRRAWLSSLKWALIVLLVFFAVTQVITSTGAMESYGSVAPLLRLLSPVQPLSMFLMYAAVSAWAHVRFVR